MDAQTRRRSRLENRIFAALLPLLLGATIYDIQLQRRRLAMDTKVQSAGQATRAQVEPGAASSAWPTVAVRTNEIQAQQKLVANLRSDVEQRRGNLDALASRLLREENSGLENSPPPDIVSGVEDQRLEVEELSSRLAQVQAQARELELNSNINQAAGRVAGSEVEQALSSQLNDAQLQMATLEAQAVTLRQQPLDFNAIQALNDLQPLIDQKRIVIQQLMKQRDAVLQSQSAGQVAESGRASMNVATLQKQAVALAAELQAARDSYQQMLKVANQTKDDEQQRQTALKQLQNQYDSDRSALIQATQKYDLALRKLNSLEGKS